MGNAGTETPDPLAPLLTSGRSSTVWRSFRHIPADPSQRMTGTTLLTSRPTMQVAPKPSYGSARTPWALHLTASCPPSILRMGVRRQPRVHKTTSPSAPRYLPSRLSTISTFLANNAFFRSHLYVLIPHRCIHVINKTSAGNDTLAGPLDARSEVRRFHAFGKPTFE